MKKLTLIILSLLMVVSLASCTGGNGGKDTTTAAPGTTATPGTTAEAEETTKAPETTAEAVKSWDGKTTEEIINILVAAGDIHIMAPTTVALATSDDAAFLQLGALDFAEATAYMPMISSQRFDMAVFRLKDGADVKAFTADLKEKNSKIQWICATPPDFIAVEAVGNVVLYFSIDSTLANGEAVRTAFLNPAS